MLPIRFWLAGLLIGRYSYAQNIIVAGHIVAKNIPNGASAFSNITFELFEGADK